MVRVRIRKGRVYVNLGRVGGMKLACAVFADGLARDGAQNLDGYWRPLWNPIYRDAPSYLIPQEMKWA